MNQLVQPVKQRLLMEIEALPEDRLPEVLNFVHFLRYQENQLPIAETVATEGNPLLAYIGGVEHGALAQQIDEDVGMGFHTVPG